MTKINNQSACDLKIKNKPSFWGWILKVSPYWALGDYVILLLRCHDIAKIDYI